MASSAISLQPLTSGPQFNWFFLLELIVCGILTLFFLFYFNRFLATLVSYGIRAYTWHYYRAYVDIQALQVSLLGGRIFFKGIRYHGVNETVLIQRGHITWNYWMRTVRRLDLTRKDTTIGTKDPNHGGSASANADGQADGTEESGGLKAETQLPCRIVIALSGLEWFLYNRTPAYDDLLSGFTPSTDATPESQEDNGSSTSGASTSRQASESDLSPRFKPTISKESTSGSEPPVRPQGHRMNTAFSSIQDMSSQKYEALEAAWSFLQFLPIQVDCTKGAIVAGNEATHSLLTVTFDKGVGSIDASDAGPLDIYRQLFNFDFSHPVVQIRPNPDFKQEQLATARAINPSYHDEAERKSRRSYRMAYRRRKHEVWHSLRNLVPYFQSSVESFHEKGTNTTSTSHTGFPVNDQWLGLSRYMDETTENHEGWNAVEYARYSTILDCPSLSLTYFWDIPGKVPSEHHESNSSVRKASMNDINGDSPPDWGMELKIKSGTINYGPWADRERIKLQNVFFPNNFRSAQAETALKPGSVRRSTKFKFVLEIAEETTLRIPTREESKDWQWKGRADAIRSASKLKKQKSKRQLRGKESEKTNASPEIRPFGWLTFRISQDSTVTYDMDMVASDKGFFNQLRLDLRDCKLSSSVNHGLLWQSARQVITCDLSNPLVWNAPHTWSFNVVSHDLQLFLLRDHIFLMTDLVSDWTSNSTSDYYTFVPFVYNLQLSFIDLRLYLNVNESNIINSPSDLDDNTFIVLKVPSLMSNVSIPSDIFRAEQSDFSFDVATQECIVDLVTPLWHTLHTFLKDNSLGRFSNLSITGTYTLNAGSALLDTLAMDIVANDPKCYLYGFLIRYFMKIRENYFGDDMHFKTLEEFQELANAATENRTAQIASNPAKKHSELDVILNLVIRNPCALLPTNLYDHSKCLRLNASSLDLDLRFTSYYMDLQVDLTPTEVSMESIQSDGKANISNVQLFIDGISVYGHRLFGLPPAEPTYVCNWDFEVGKIVGECSTQFLRSAGAAIRNLDFTMDDEENAFPPLHPFVLHDVTFLRAKIASVHLSVLIDQSALVLAAGLINFKLNDWSRSRFSKRLTVDVPDVMLSAIDSRSAARQSERSTSVTTYALIRTNIILSMLVRKSNLLEHRKHQQDHIRISDQRTHRTPWLFLNSNNADTFSEKDGSKVHPPTMAIPMMPEPVAEIMHTIEPSNFLSRDRHFLSHKGSFLSFDGSSSRRVKQDYSTPVSSNSAHRNLNARQETNPTSYTHEPHIYGGATHILLDPGQIYDRDSTVPSYDIPRSMIGPSSPWSMPHFHYYKIIPDSSHLPPLPKLAEDRGNVIEDNFIANFGDNGLAHSDLFCEVQPGLQGYCTPEFFQVISSLLSGLQASDPIDVIDSLQVDVISHIVKHQKAKEKQPKTASSFSVKIPSAIFTIFNKLEEMEDDPQCPLQDQYQVSCTQFKLTMQTKSEKGEHDMIRDSREDTILHSTAEHISISAMGGQTNTCQDRAELRLLLEDIMFWIVASSKTSSHLQLRTFEVLNATKSAAPLACLVQRTTTIVDFVASSFQAIPSIDDRLRYLVWFITDSAIGVPDPLFVTRPAYVLRGLQSHLRLHDSWKITSRLRNMYRTLPLDKQKGLTTSFLNVEYRCPGNARDEVLREFNNWRPWDLAHVEKSHAMKVIWGDTLEHDTSPEKPVTLSCDLKTIRAIIEPGAKHCDISVVDMYVAIAFASTTIDKRNSLCIRSHCAGFALGLRWEILDLIEGITEAMSRTQSASTVRQAPNYEHPEPSQVTEIHVFVGTDDGSINFGGINIELFLHGYGLNGSFVLSPGIEKQPEQATILLNGQGCSTKISSQSKSLMLWEVLQPHFYGSHISRRSRNRVKDGWKMAGSCLSLVYNMQEDPLNFIHIASRVVEDEVQYISAFIRRLDISSPPSPPSKHIEEVKGMARDHGFQVALFLEDYQLNFRLLPSLIYSIDGKVARMSVLSDIVNEIEVDFDIKKNHHIFHAVEKEKSRSVSEIDIPPINGRISGTMSTEIMSLKADVTVERIKLEASALRSLLDVVRRPEMSHYISDCSSSLTDLRLHLSETLARREPRPQSPVGSTRQREIAYNVRLTMAGWLIHARAPGLKNKNYSADMNIILGSTQAHIDSSDENARFESPNLHVNVSHIGLELIKDEHSRAQPYGSVGLDIGFRATSRSTDRDQTGRVYDLSSKGFNVQLYAETASLVIDIVAHLQNRIRSLDLSEDMRRLKHLGRLARARSHGPSNPLPELNIIDMESHSLAFLQAIYSVELSNIQICWIMDQKYQQKTVLEPEDLVFSIRKVALSTSGDNSAKLRIQDTQLQIAPKSQDKGRRSLNSALMPEVVFNVAYLFAKDELRLAFQAAGKALDIRSTTGFILPASLLQKSIASAAERLREANTIWSTSPSQTPSGNALLGNRRLSSLLVDVDFAGAVLTLLGRQLDDQQTRLVATATGKRLSEGRYGQYVQGDSTTTASLTSPGVALKVQYGDNGLDDPTLNAELRVSPSSNTLFPTVVPLIKQITTSIKEVVGDQSNTNMSSSSLLQTPKMLEDRSIDATNPESILGRCKLNIGLRICKQEFCLSCQPIARVAATAQFEEIFVTVNTVQSQEQRRFFAILIACNNLEASVKHVYSNESTASFEVESVVMSLMNSKHVSTTSGISAILKVSPMKTMINAKQVQDFLLFREIWVPSDDEDAPNPGPNPGPTPAPTPSDSQALMVQRYQQVASAEAFPWNAVLSIDELQIQLDLGQTLGKAEFIIKNFWVSSKKKSNLEQNLCGGFDIMAIESRGRMSGSVTLEKMRVRTSIQWPNESAGSGQTPLIQASIGFGQLQANTSFEYQPFLVADIVAFDFLMYNVRQPVQDRLVSILEGEKVQVFCTTLTASQSLALFQTWQRLVQDKHAAYEASLKEIERFFRRKSMMTASTISSPSLPQTTREDDGGKSPVTLHTDVVVTLKVVNVGAFPSTFFDNQIFKMEALDAQARFGVSLEDDKIHSSLGLTLGQLRVALSGVNRPTAVEMKKLSVAEVAARATGSRGGTILKVPRVLASMQTWQGVTSNEIDYIFKSAFEGKVDVGWNYSRISFIRGMWAAHSRALADRLGKPLPPSAVRISGGPKPGVPEEGGDDQEETGDNNNDSEEQDKDERITAVVDVPQSKYVYRPLEPPLIETPQLRDMGEATPPLEWIGLNRERLPNITHQIIIVTLLEIAKEVSDAYGKILG
ncbi:fermentation associated protein (Csf1), putative [Talaromyces stipitatus ATCC 10500]|uniref:Fermentation associated protein (Csf1), putative n=1 Tax=Talaromyces stipitatus (strain ATCC 10500 / CBS 375.48 / QM 6759 / NRRL 1006) TaxID=441959 RepID=B8MRQ1_TALSN|nr:fermentation associated protein (Csf1), putative [Talaromyces stipitatus ATCC 10500]EED13208.1 fermentation associated protein (Csf1), putative [Talaromyces stipitatus ATCC 10500]